MRCYITSEDSRYPLIIIEGETGISGYFINPGDGSVENQVCICAAREPSECCCSYPWEEEYYT